MKRKNEKQKVKKLVNLFNDKGSTKYFSLVHKVIDFTWTAPQKACLYDMNNVRAKQG